MIKNIIKSGNNVFLLYTSSMDSKAGVYLLKYLCEKIGVNVSVAFTKYNGDIPKELPNPEYNKNVVVVCVGVTLDKGAENYIHNTYEVIVYKNDGKHSVAKEIFDSIKKHPDFVHVNIDQPNVSKWVSFIGEFHVRNEEWNENDPKIKHLIYFNLASSMYNTWVNSNGRNYYWDKLISIPGEFIAMLLHEGEEIYKYKRDNQTKLLSYITKEEINGYKCLLANKRDVDSSFFQCKDSDVDFLIAYEASADYKQKQHAEKHMFNIDIQKAYNQEILASVVPYITVTFTVYRNKSNLNVLDFIKKYQGSGHEKVGSFTIKDYNDLEKLEIASIRIVKKMYDDTNTDAVKKYKQQVQGMYIKRGLVFNKNIHVVNNLTDFDIYSDVNDNTQIILYRFDNKSITKLLNSL